MISTALVNSVNSTEIFNIQKCPPKVFLKFKLSFTKFTGKNLCQGHRLS